MAKYSIEDSTLTAIANAIREKDGSSAALTPAGMASAIAAIQAGGGASVDICTVTVSITQYIPNNVMISGVKLVDGELVGFADTFNTTNSEEKFVSPYVLTNIVKNSALTIDCFGAVVMGTPKYSGCSELYRLRGACSLAAKITAENATITIPNDY